MNHTPIIFAEKFSKITEYYQPKIIAQMNDYHFKLAKVKDDFIWHHHAETDEVFIVLSGELEIKFRDGQVTLKEGEMYIIPKGMEHKPFAKEECHLMMIEPMGTLNTGDSHGERTVADPEWI